MSNFEFLNKNNSFKNFVKACMEAEKELEEQTKK